MKVRHKRTGVVYDNAEMKTYGYRIVMPDGEIKAFEGKHLEIVDEPRWQDVTEECDVGWDGIKLRYPDGRENELPPNYRLRKVQLRKNPTFIAGAQHESLQWAFLIERKVSD